ncbi:MAG: hypothetical protein VXY99_07680 [Pseudomonadota bacterium]|nr:hypothetical protein [Pseudomonadota bacterium]
MQTFTRARQQQHGAGKYVYLHPWAFWSLGPALQKRASDQISAMTPKTPERPGV